MEKAWENVHAQATIGFGFTSDWLKKWCKNIGQITEWSNHKPKHSLITFDTQLKTALIIIYKQEVIFEKHLTIKKCDKTFLKFILRLRNC